MIVGTEDGNVFLYAYGVFPVGMIDLNQHGVGKVSWWHKKKHSLKARYSKNNFCLVVEPLNINLYCSDFLLAKFMQIFLKKTCWMPMFWMLWCKKVAKTKRLHVSQIFSFPSLDRIYYVEWWGALGSVVTWLETYVTSSWIGQRKWTTSGCP